MSINISQKLIIIIALMASVACTPIWLFADFSWDIKLLISLFFIMVSVLTTHFLLRDISEGIESLETGLLNLKDGEFSTTLAYNRDDEIGKLCQLYNETVTKLRDEKHWLYQRELLLDKVTQSSPEVLLLVNNSQQIIFSNIAARDFFQLPQGLEGLVLDDLFRQIENHKGKGVEQAIKQGDSGLFSLTHESGDTQTWHIATGNFLLNNQNHTLYILKQMTRELSRQEVAVWKKVIRVISHELNNSLGPISSMLHSGKLLSGNNKDQRLERVFSTIDERIQHLSSFVQGYGKFAKLPEPKVTSIEWLKLSESLQAQWQFINLTPKNITFHADAVQLEQLLINLLKNAHEAEGAIEKISLAIQEQGSDIVLTISDRGKGLSEIVMANALIPFYSTKAAGSGLGLALCREIVDAHRGHITLHNRKNGGLTVKVILPKTLGLSVC